MRKFSIMRDMKIERMEQIYYTRDYDKFKFEKTNRDIKVTNDLKDSIAQKGIVEPITVNENMEILDGQHRFMVAKSLNEIIPFKMVSGLKLIDILDTKSTAKNWTPKDYINYYCKINNKNYITLNEMIKSEKLSHNELVTLYHIGNYNPEANRGGQIIKSGKLNMFAHKEFGDNALRMISDIGNYVDTSSSRFRKALLTVFGNEEYNHERMLKQVSKYGSQVLFEVKSWSYIQCCIKLRELYNFRQANKVLIYKGDIV